MTYHYKITELKHVLKLVAHCFLQMFGLGLSELTAGEIKHFLAQKLQYFHVVLADGLVCFAGAHNVADERGPVLGPFIL